MQAKDFDYRFIEVICSDLKIIFITDEKSQETGATDVHMHSFWELFYLQDGEFSVKSDGDSYELSTGQMLLIPPNHYHSTVSSQNAIKKSVFFTFEKLKASHDDPLFNEIYTSFSTCGFQKIYDAYYLGELLDRIFTNMSVDLIAKKWRLKANVTELIFSLYDRMQSSVAAQDDLAIKQNSYWVYKYAIDRLLDIYYMDDISLDELGEKLFLSPQNITRIISTAYGKSFNDLKFELKMRNAKRLLAETALSVNEVGKRIGYTTARGFLSAFSKYEGCTPTEYRNKKE